MVQKKYKNKKRFTVSLILSFAFIISILLPIFIPSSASAAIKNVSDQRDRTILYALIRCLKGTDATVFVQNADPSALREQNMSGIVDHYIDGQTMAVGYEIDSDDGNATCTEMSLVRAMRPIHKTPEWFFHQIYDYGAQDPDSFTFPRQADAEVERLAGKLNKEMGKYDLSIGRDEKLRRLATAFWICAEPAPDPPDRDTTTYNGKKYQLRSDAPGEVSVGYDLESDNGKYACDTLMHWGTKNGVNDMADAIKAHAEGTTPGSVGGADPTGSLTDCDTKLLNPLSWIICPLIDIGSDASDYIFQNIAVPLLEDVPIELNSNDGAYSAWQGFRFIANIMIIGTMLVIVYVQARGGPS